MIPSRHSVQAVSVRSANQLGPALEFTVPKCLSKPAPGRSANLRTFAGRNAVSSIVLQPKNENLPATLSASYHHKLKPSGKAYCRTPRQRHIAPTTTTTYVSGRVAKSTPPPTWASSRIRQSALSPAFEPVSTIKPSQPTIVKAGPSPDDSSNYERDLLKFCTKSAQAMGRYIMDRRAKDLSSSPPKVCSTASLLHQCEMLTEYKAPANSSQTDMFRQKVCILAHLLFKKDSNCVSAC